MHWPSIAYVTERAPLPDGYRYEYLTRARIGEVIAAVRAWYPGIAVGNASCHLRESFYLEKVCLEDAPDRDFLVTLIVAGGGIGGIYSVERDPDSAVIYGRIATVSPAHRGAGLSRALLRLTEVLGRAMGMGMVYGLATLNHPHMQRVFERVGWQLIGIIPGFDKEEIAPAEVRRVYEAVYVKVLEPENLLRPSAANMTPSVEALFDLLYPGQSARPGASP